MLYQHLNQDFFKKMYERTENTIGFLGILNLNIIFISFFLSIHSHLNKQYIGTTSKRVKILKIQSCILLTRKVYPVLLHPIEFTTDRKLINC